MLRMRCFIKLVERCALKKTKKKQYHYKGMEDSGSLPYSYSGIDAIYVVDSDLVQTPTDGMVNYLVSKGISFGIVQFRGAAATNPPR